MIIIWDNPAHIQSLKATLQRQFNMKDLGPLNYFMSIEIFYGPRGYLLSQQKYICDLVSRT